jgi:hypothetical protein
MSAHQDSEPDRITPEMLAVFRECHFMHVVFEARDAYRTVKPIKDLWDYMKKRAEKGEERFDDPEEYEEVEGGWDHEHCDVCMGEIGPGNSYWANERPGDVDLCEKCYPRVSALLHETESKDGRSLS